MKDWPGADLTTAQWKNMIDDLCKAGCFSVLLTGGEVLLRLDFTEIYLYLKKKGFKIVVFSNGTLLTAEHFSLFKEWPPDAVDITVHGYSKETYGLVTGKPELFSLMKNNIALLAQNHIPFSLKTSLLKEIKSDLLNIKKLAEEYGVKFRFDTYIHARRNGDTNPFEHRLSAEEAAILENEENAEKFESFFCEMETKEFTNSHLPRFFNCSVETKNSQIFISSNGTFAPCNALVPWGISFKETTLSAFNTIFWNRFYNQPPFKKGKLEGCLSCQYRMMCQVCGITTIYEQNTKSKPCEFCCNLCLERNKIWKNKKGGQKYDDNPFETEKEEICTADHCQV
jgi:MoaA/NifB/PqqE/SkfB family radical SAM enzyme